MTIGRFCWPVSPSYYSSSSVWCWINYDNSSIHNLFNLVLPFLHSDFLQHQGLKRCKYELAYLYLKYLAKRPERKFITSRVTSFNRKAKVVEEHPKAKEKIEYRSDAEMVLPSEASTAVAEDEISQKVRFEEVVVQLFQRRVCSLPESDLSIPPRGTFEESTHEKIDKRPSKFLRRLTYPPDSREQSSHKLDMKESLTKKLNEHREMIKSRIEEFSPVFFFRSNLFLHFAKNWIAVIRVSFKIIYLGLVKL